MKSNINPKIFGIILLCLWSLITQAQTKIKVIDANTNKAIPGLNFQYNNVKGSSDSEGLINVELDDNSTLQLSHLSYGTWSLNAQELNTAAQKGTIKRAPLEVNLFPVTVIGMHDHKDTEQNIQLSYQDNLSHDGASILTQIPAINGIRKSGSYGIDPVMRGFKYEQLNIIINGGQNAIAACPNRMDPPSSQISPNTIGEIEILKGPYALRYGNAVGGTINFKQSKLNYSDKADVYGRATGGYEGNGNQTRTEALVGLSGKKYNIGILGAYSEGNDYKNGNNNTVQADYLRYSYGINGRVAISKTQNLSFSAVNNIAKDVDFPALAMDLRSDDTWILNAQHELNFNNKNLQHWKTLVYGSLVDHTMDNYSKKLDPRMVNADTKANTKAYGVRTEGFWSFNNSVLYAGADYRFENADGERTRNMLMGEMQGNTIKDNVWQDAQISKTGLFAEYSITQNRFRYTLSGRLELNQRKANDPDTNFASLYNDLEKTQVNPGISAGINKALNANNNLSFWLGRVQRSASLTESYINFFPVGLDPYEMIGNPDLNSEINNQADIIWEFKRPKTQISFDVFAAYLQDYISSVIDPNIDPKMPSSPGVRQYININNALKTGFEASWQQDIAWGVQHNLSLAYTYGKDLERDEPLPEIAPLDIRYTLMGKYFNNTLFPIVSIRHVIKQDRISEEFGETKTPSFTLLDATISYRFLKFCSATVGVNNLLDQAYYEHLSRSVKGSDPTPIYAPGRNVFVSLNIDLQ